MLEIRSFRDLLRLFFIYKREFRLAFGTVLIVVILGAFLLPARYEATARLLVKPGRENATLPIEIANRQALISPSTQRDPVVDEEKLLTGKPVIRAVANEFQNKIDSYQPHGTWDSIKHTIKQTLGDIKEGMRNVLVALDILEPKPMALRLAERMEKSFSVHHDGGSMVMELSFVWGDPQTAKDILTLWIDTYLSDRTASLGRSSLQSFYENELQIVDTNIVDLKSKLQQKYQKINSAGIKDTLDSITHEINQLNSLRTEKQTEAIGIKSLIAQADEALKQLPGEVVTEREISLNPIQMDMKLKLNALEEERIRLLRDFVETAPPIQSIDQSIAQTKRLISQQAALVERSQNKAPNSIATNIRQSRVDSSLKLSSLNSEITSISKKIKDLQAHRHAVLSAEPEISLLTRQLDSAENSYALYAKNLEQARIDKALDDNRISNIATIEHATADPRRIFPNTLMLLLLVIPASLSCGLIVVYACNLADQRIHDAGKLEDRFGVTVWAQLPDLVAHPDMTPAFRASLYRVLGVLPLETARQEGLSIALTATHEHAGLQFIIRSLDSLLREQGLTIQRDLNRPIGPGEIALLNAGALLQNPSALLTLRQAQYRILVLEAKRSTVPMLKNALSILETAFGKVDGIILNRRQFEVPNNILSFFERS